MYFLLVWSRERGAPDESAWGRSIGVSNFTLELLQRIVKMGKTVPAVNQVRLASLNGHR